MEFLVMIALIWGLGKIFGGGQKQQQKRPNTPQQPNGQAPDEEWAGSNSRGSLDDFRRMYESMQQEAADIFADDDPIDEAETIYFPSDEPVSRPVSETMTIPMGRPVIITMNGPQSSGQVECEAHEDCATPQRSIHPVQSLVGERAAAQPTMQSRLTKSDLGELKVVKPLETIRTQGADGVNIAAFVNNLRLSPEQKGLIWAEVFASPKCKRRAELRNGL